MRHHRCVERSPTDDGGNLMSEANDRGQQPRGDDYCYLTTTGRRTGTPHRIEIWYAADGRTVYLLSGGGRSADWVQNLAVDPSVLVEIGGEVRRGRARLLDAGDEDARARSMVFDKYSSRSGSDLTEWRQRALPVAIDLDDA
jgi:deazaflavin-dependent oxidoreductase (nitroreductase family)